MAFRRTLLRPLVPVYAAALALKQSVQARRPSGAQRLPEAVISIGSLSAGGAGKTPLVLALSKALTKRDYTVLILTRGYGRRVKTIERVDPEGDAARFGDEPLMLAQRSAVPVFVGANRYRAGLLARDLPASHRVVYLLDDGFQHRRLARDLNIVLLTQQDVEDTLLPAGNLREPLSRLGEADVIVIREEEQEPLRKFLDGLNKPRKRPDDAQPAHPAVWLIRRRLDFDADARRPERPLGFCAIARPENFRDMLAKAEVQLLDLLVFRDHHAYSQRNIDRLVQTAKRLSADGFMTTEKDAVKLTSAMRSQLESLGPLSLPRLTAELVEEKTAVEQIIGRVSQLNRRRRIASA